ncbi:multidrug ABC transporter ATP-binding protein [Actinoplanes ianthinogenes]|uniref:Multidrug ABC transporter ATP-binding protein n=1 Tax=Actinoplanes ianthinogenes TaxID=122358 RepID=A0ABM7LK13_9ACTN|nr:ATP-binding cassette domain-containing protein [Actinoplanes ianthinogenes]BCJ39493.1 multidrug ABC transporter ATP-binding protein [Actinoplanes ianthinogenes]GGR35701.1 multidrug ABC transporter ATP-binding protein [Actinoplanes ianthinogenes]
MIEVDGLVKRFGTTTAVDGLSFEVRPGRVTGFLGPNGAGKSTTMRMILGLDRPSAGRATVAGRAYREHPAPLKVAGALLEGRAVHRGRTAREHLLGLARTHGIGRTRVNEVLAEAGLAAVATRRAGGFSLGMGQRLGIAAALLGDPAVVILDEPVNGLDPDGVLWIRTLLRRLAAEGRTVLVSSHLMSEMAVTADHLLVIGNGRLLADTALDDLLGQDRCLVRSSDPDGLRDLLTARGATVTAPATGLLEVAGLGIEEIGATAAARHLVVYELTPVKASLEQAYMALVRS